MQFEYHSAAPALCDPSLSRLQEYQLKSPQKSIFMNHYRLLNIIYMCSRMAVHLLLVACYASAGYGKVWLSNFKQRLLAWTEKSYRKNGSICLQKHMVMMII